MPYAILRFAKKKMGAVSAAYAHNERKKEAYKSNPDIDTARKPDNYHLIQPQQTYRREIQRLIQAAACKTRKDSTVMVETLITASPEFMNKLPPPGQREYFQRAYDFIANKIGQQNIIAATVHMDEKTPHMHLSFCPITPDGRLSAKDILGNQAKLSKWQTEYHSHMAARWPKLERGASALETKRKHIPVWLFKQAAQLDKRLVEVENALADITALNAKKKREAAIALLQEWFPQAKRFTAQIKTVDAHIKALEQAAKVANERTAVVRGDMKNRLEDKDGELRQARQEAMRLQEILRQQQSLMRQIPPDILERIQKKPKERGQDR